MEKRIGLELRGRKHEEVEELNLDNCKSPNIDGLTDKFTNLKQLSLNSAGLTSLKGFPTLPSLRRLEMSDNRISGGLEALSGCTALKVLNLSGNRIKEVEALQPLAQLPQLRSLDLFHCDVTNADNYRDQVFKLIPALVALDGFDKNEEEVDDEEDEDVNGVDEEDGAEDEEDGEDDEDAEEEDAEDGEDEEDEVGLSAIYKDGLEDEDGDEDFDGEDAEDEEDVDDVDEEEEEDAAAADVQNIGEDGGGDRGKKRKHEEEEDA